MYVWSLSRVQLFVTPWTGAHQAPWPGILSMGFSRQEYWSGLPFPSPQECVKKSKSTLFLEAVLKCSCFTFYVCIY